MPLVYVVLPFSRFKFIVEQVVGVGVEVGIGIGVGVCVIEAIGDGIDGVVTNGVGVVGVKVGVNDPEAGLGVTVGEVKGTEMEEIGENGFDGEAGMAGIAGIAGVAALV